MYKSQEDELGYAKLEGPDIHQIIKKTKVTLGRDTKLRDNPPLGDEQYVYLGANKKISRQHLSIYFDYDKHEWYAKNYSKNPVTINKVTLNRDDCPRNISPIAAIQIAELKFYFFQSKKE